MKKRVLNNYDHAKVIRDADLLILLRLAMYDIQLFLP